MYTYINIGDSKEKNDLKWNVNMKKERFDDKKIHGGNGWGDALKSMGTLCIHLYICIL
jgi:hypothetical protein